ncbi:hypothetical protein [Yunchengibacter salinarum]|uniref:hypothetical protein n=1 Tax=Yunchengibacter salinarum TaxID=3133399 RepID=UPI0035B5D1C2
MEAAPFARAADGPLRAVLPMYTHGETAYARALDGGGVEGPGVTLFRCAMARLKQDVVIRLAPLSRAGRLLESDRHLIWFPVALRDAGPRQPRQAGPMATLETRWHVLKTATLTPDDPAFMQQARATAFHGSRLSKEIQKLGMTFVKGSAEPKRLLGMLYTGEVDAVLSVPLERTLEPKARLQMQSKVDVFPYRTWEIGYEVSRGLMADHPRFPADFDTALSWCMDGAPAQQQAGAGTGATPPKDEGASR